MLIAWAFVHALGGLLADEGTELGVGMATAIFVDATIVRMVLVPAVMQLMGRANWWIPGWLDRALPRVGIEAQRASVPSEARS